MTSIIKNPRMIYRNTCQILSQVFCTRKNNFSLSAPVPLCQSVIKRLDDFSSDETLRVAVGTYNINGGKHFRSVVYKNVSLDDWLIDPHKQNNESRFLFRKKLNFFTFLYMHLNSISSCWHWRTEQEWEREGNWRLCNWIWGDGWPWRQKYHEC